MTHLVEVQFANQAQNWDAFYIMKVNWKMSLLNTHSVQMSNIFLSYCWFLSATVEQIVAQCVLFLRESILKTAKALVEDTKLLVAGAASTQEKLAQAAHSSAKTITQLTEVVKLGATSMGSEDPETQVMKIQNTFSLIKPQISGPCALTGVKHLNL